MNLIFDKDFYFCDRLQYRVAITRNDRWKKCHFATKEDCINETSAPASKLGNLFLVDPVELLRHEVLSTDFEGNVLLDLKNVNCECKSNC